MSLQVVGYNQENRHLELERGLTDMSYREAERGNMLPITEKRGARFPYRVLALEFSQHPNPNGIPSKTLLGHVAVTHFEDGIATVGGLIVNERHRRRGVGLSVVTYLLETVKSELPEFRACYAFANETSAQLFEKAGGVIIGERQPPQPSGCNTTIDLAPAIKGLGS